MAPSRPYDGCHGAGDGPPPQRAAGGGSGQPMSAAQRRRQRRLRSMLEKHVGRTGTEPATSPYGTRPAPLAEVSEPQVGQSRSVTWLP